MFRNEGIEYGIGWWKKEIKEEGRNQERITAVVQNKDLMFLSNNV
jgi:hypothetical protein